MPDLSSDDLRKEWELRMAQMRADIDNKAADNRYKLTMLGIEAWKVFVTGIAATAALVGVTAGLLGYKIGQIPPPPIVIQIQQPAAPVSPPARP